MKRHVAIIVSVMAVIFYWQCLPTPLFNKPVSTIMVDAHGELLAAHIATDDQWRFPTIEFVPEKFKQAILHFEDKRFYSHPGVDPLAMMRALYLNVKQGRVVSGGSTLTMQVIRMARDNQPRTLKEKLIEAIMSTRLELMLDKDQILALHASHAPYGGNVVGLEAASWRYFGRTPQQLSWAESATLAVLPNSPALIHPGRNREQLKQKRDRLLQTLHDEGVIDAIELKLALLEPLPEQPNPLPRYAPHLLDTLMQAKNAQRIRTTLDRHIQMRIERVTRQHAQSLAARDIHNLAVLVIDNSDFTVKAYVGNSQYANDLERGYAVDIVQRPRSTGSILKPLLFARMIQSGEILPDTLIPDLPTQYAGYMPENFDRQYRGAVAAKQALASSLNIPAVRMLRQHGVDRFYEYLQHAGMTTLNRPVDDYGLTLILGGAEGTLWDMTNLYANLAYVAKQDRYDNDTKYQQIHVSTSDSATTSRISDIGQAAAWMTLDALVEVARPGNENYWREFSSSRTLAWKTGTSYGMRDGWAIGSDTKYTVGVWVGNANGEGKAGLTGIQAAAPVLFDVFDKLDRPAQWFSAPKHLMKPVSICKDNGYLTNAACDSKKIWIPKESHFQQISPHHRLVHLDKDGKRVHGRCESVKNMHHVSWFSLPAGQAFYYEKSHSGYKVLPQFRADCRPQWVENRQDGPIDLLYPLPDTRIYIPTDLASTKSRTVFEAVHREQDSVLYWHLDQHYLGTTASFHQLALNISPGEHVLTVVDGNGQRLTRRFEVLGQ